MIGAIDRKYASIREKLTSYSVKSIKRLQRQEAKLKRELEGKDSLAAKQLFAQSQDKYNQLLSSVKNSTSKISKSLTNYVPGLDTLQTAFPSETYNYRDQKRRAVAVAFLCLQICYLAT